MTIHNRKKYARQMRAALHSVPFANKELVKKMIVIYSSFTVQQLLTPNKWKHGKKVQRPSENKWSVTGGREAANWRTEFSVISMNVIEIENVIFLHRQLCSVSCFILQIFHFPFLHFSVHSNTQGLISRIESGKKRRTQCWTLNNPKKGLLWAASFAVVSNRYIIPNTIHVLFIL